MREVQCTSENPCTAVQLLVQKTTEHDKAIDSMKNRLPLWATMAFTAAGTTIGILAAQIR